MAPLTIDADLAAPACTTTFNAAALTLVGRSTLGIRSFRKDLGDMERMTVTGLFDTEILTVLYEGSLVRLQVVYNGGDGNDVVLVRLPSGTVISVR